jgi:hypothetical protein
MKRSLLTFTLVATTMFSTVLVSPAMSQEPPEPAMAGAERNGPALPPPHENGPRPERPEFRPGGPDHRFADIFLASKLSGAEIYIGITPEQLGVWRAYTTALLDLVGSNPGERNGPPPAPKAGPAPDGSAEQDNRRDNPKAIFGERLADRVIEKAASANALKKAAETLKTTLQPEQLKKLSELEGALMGPPPRPDQNMRPDRPHG